MKRLYPVICARNVARSAVFYRALFELRPVFETDWYVHLEAVADSTPQMGIVDRGHASVPEPFRAAPRGVFVTVEVEDARRFAERARGLGLEMVCDLRDEPWGQRHFIVADPDGAPVDVVEPIPPAAEFSGAGEAG